MSADACLRHLLRLCQGLCRAGSTAAALEAVAMLPGRLHGVGSLIRHRNRLGQITNWISRLLTTEVGNHALSKGVVGELRGVLQPLPFFGPDANFAAQGVRSWLLRAVAVPTFAIINWRLKQQFETILRRDRNRPDDPTQNLYLLLHLAEDQAAMFARFIDLYEPEVPFTDEDIRALKSVSRMRFEEAFAGLFAAAQGGIVALRSMHDLDQAVPMVERLTFELQQGGETSYYLINLI